MTLHCGTPNEKQRLFLLDRHRYVAFGGARGGGKSWAVQTKAALLSLRFPGIKVMIVRRTYPELRANHINEMRAKLYGIASYNDTNKEMKFPNGSMILFKYAQNEADLEKFQGNQVDVLFIDEATQFTEGQYDRFCACVRGVNDFPKRSYLTCNPGGVGHTWVTRLFLDRQFREGEDPEAYTFIPSRVTDNLALMEKDPAYIRQLQALPPKLRKAWLDGDWNIFEGQFFEEFRDDPAHYMDRRFTHVIEPFEIPDGWTVFRSFDFGYARPFSCAWWAVDYDGTAYRILELYGCRKDSPNEGVKWHPDKIFAEIHRLETEHRWLKGKRIHGVADPSIWDASRGEAIIEAADRHCVYFEKGDNKRLPGWMQIHYRLAFDEQGFPMLYVFKNCEGFIRTVPTLQYDEHAPEDLDTDGEDHIADETRYFCMMRPIAPRQAPEKDGWEQTPAYMYLDVKREDVRATARKPELTIFES